MRKSNPVRSIRTKLAFLFLVLTAGVIALFGRSLEVQAQSTQSQTAKLSGSFATPVADATIDNGASAEWVDGVERPVQNPAFLRQLVWTRTNAPGGGSLAYGASPKPGVRHLRLGFTNAIAVGSVLVRGGDRLSVLRANAAYPGNLANDADWLPAARVVNRQISNAEVALSGYALWILPPGTRTRALRFTHTAAATDSNFAGNFGGAYLLSTRMANIAPQAAVYTSANQPAAQLLNDEQYNGWRTWDNGPDFRHAVTPGSPEWIVLVWPKPVALNGLAALWAGFNAADAEVFSGPDNVSPQDAPGADWKPSGQPLATHNQYPRGLGVDWLDFGRTITTRAVRLRITQVTDESHHQHLQGKTNKGTRVWLGELMALAPLQGAGLSAAILPAPADTSPKPPIPVNFTLDTASFVTLVIDDAKGNRVRNLVSDTWFEKGANTVWWDGTDDLSRNADAANHGVYLIPTHFVAPGSYRVRGLVHGAIDLHYEFTVYDPGHPGWETADTKGGWLTNHTPPESTLFVPASQAPGGKPLVYLGSYISEGGAGLAWVDLDGNKQGGRGWIGGAWTAAPFLARDTGTQPDPAVYAYVGAPWGDNTVPAGKPATGTIRLTGLTAHGDKSIFNYTYNPGSHIELNNEGRIDWTHGMGGLAVHNSLAVISMPLQNQLLFVDARAGKALATASLESPQGLAFTPDGRLLVLSGKSLLRYTVPSDLAHFNPAQLGRPDAIVNGALTDPAGITVDTNGDIYISDGGASNQVHVYDAAGKLLRSIGHAGPSQAGPYDPLHMNHPVGLSIDGNRHLWVAEDDFQPKRVSVWSLDGQLLKAFYGPSEYGGGGSLDPQDKTKFYYHGMEFKLDWKAGTNAVTSILYRPGKDDIPMPATAAPTTPLYSKGHRYFINSYLGHGTNGVTIGALFLDRGGILHPVAAMGRANDWPLLRGEQFKSKLPAGADLTSGAPDHEILFTWSDSNENGKVDPEEVSFVKSPD